MDQSLQKKILQLSKSTQNLNNAVNPAQVSAAKKFLTERALVLNDERKRIEEWLEEADEYINSEMPEINSQPSNEYNQQWKAALDDYESISNALSEAWRTLMGEEKAA